MFLWKFIFPTIYLLIIGFSNRADVRVIFFGIHFYRVGPTESFSMPDSLFRTGPNRAPNATPNLFSKIL